MSITLFKASFKANWKFTLGVTLFIMMYVSIAISMYDPAAADKMKSMFDLMPEGFLKAFGFDKLGSDLSSYLTNYLYGFIMLVFPLIGSTVIANGLVAKHVDSGSMAYLITTPNSRVKIILTQAIFLITCMTFILGVNIGIALIMSEASYSGMLDIGRFMQLNLVAYLVALAVSGVSFLASCIFNDTKMSLTFGAGLPVLFIVFKMMAEISDKVESLKYLSIYTLIDIEKIMGGDASYVVLVSLILFVVTALLYGASIVLFNKRSLVI